MRFALLAWFLIALFSMRWFGIWYMNRPPKRCHSHPYQRSNWSCYWNHSNCLRADSSEGKTTRSMIDGFMIFALSFTWPLMVGPMLALWITPESNAELKERIKQAEAEVKRLEYETEVGRG